MVLTMQTLTDFRRKRAVARVIRNGDLQRKAIVAQTQLSEIEAYDPGLDAQIDLLEDRMQRDRDYLIKTAPEA